MSYIHSTMKEAKAEISREYQHAAKAVRDIGFKVVRGEPYLIACGEDGRLGEGEPYFYSGILTRKMTDQIITDSIEQYGDQFTQLYYQNCIDGADSVRDMNEGEYQPEVSCVSILIWEKK